MATQQHRAEPTPEARAFLNDLREYSDETAKGVPRLLDVARALRTGTLPDDNLLPLTKRNCLYVISKELANFPSELRNAFFQFLFQSDLVSDSTEIRNSLHALLRSRRDRPLDALSIALATSLLKSTRPPAPVVAEEIYPKLRAEFDREPRWELVGLLALSVGRNHIDYGQPALIKDIARLHKGDNEQFSRAVRLRNPLWASLSPPLDSVDIINAVGRRHTSLAHNFPSDQTIRDITRRASATVVSLPGA